MKHSYKITGMTCGGCAVKVKNELLKTPHVISVDGSKEEQQVIIELDEHISIEKLQSVLSAIGNYHIKNGNKSLLLKPAEKVDNECCHKDAAKPAQTPKRL